MGRVIKPGDGGLAVVKRQSLALGMAPCEPLG